MNEHRPETYEGRWDAQGFNVAWSDDARSYAVKCRACGYDTFCKTIEQADRTIQSHVHAHASTRSQPSPEEKGPCCVDRVLAVAAAKERGWISKSPVIAPVAFLLQRLEIVEANYEKVCGDREELRRRLREVEHDLYVAHHPGSEKILGQYADIDVDTHDHPSGLVHRAMYEQVKAEAEELRKRLDCTEAFHGLVIKEREFERLRVDRLEKEKAELQYQWGVAESKLQEIVDHAREMSSEEIIIECQKALGKIPLDTSGGEEEPS